MKKFILGLIVCSSVLTAKEIKYKVADDLMMCLHDGNKVYYSGNFTLGKNMRVNGNIKAYLKDPILIVKHLDKKGNVSIVTESKKLKITEHLNCYEILSIDIHNDGKYITSDSKMTEYAIKLYGTATEFELNVSNNDRNIKEAKEKAELYARMWSSLFSKMPSPMGENKFKSNFLKYEPKGLRNLIIEELNKKKIKIPGVNK